MHTKKFLRVQFLSPQPHRNDPVYSLVDAPLAPNRVQCEQSRLCRDIGLSNDLPGQFGSRATADIGDALNKSAWIPVSLCSTLACLIFKTRSSAFAYGENKEPVRGRHLDGFVYEKWWKDRWGPRALRIRISPRRQDATHKPISRFYPAQPRQLYEQQCKYMAFLSDSFFPFTGVNWKWIRQSRWTESRCSLCAWLNTTRCSGSTEDQESKWTSAFTSIEQILEITLSSPTIIK